MVHCLEVCRKTDWYFSVSAKIFSAVAYLKSFLKMMLPIMDDTTPTLREIIMLIMLPPPFDKKSVARGRQPSVIIAEKNIFVEKITPTINRGFFVGKYLIIFEVAEPARQVVKVVVERQ